jgi:outer membrane protein TolC
VNVSALLAVIFFIGAGCTAAPKVQAELRLELSNPNFFIEPTTNRTGQITFTEASRRWISHDQETLQQVAAALAGGLDATEARSWIWPRADIEFQETAAGEKDKNTFYSEPSGGLVLHYDFKKMFFYSDAAAMASAGRDICLQKARLAIDSAMGRFEDLVLEWRQLQDSLPLQEQRLAEFRRLMSAVHSLDQLGALPTGSFAEWNNREQVARRQYSETRRRLAGVRQVLQTGLGLTGQTDLDLGNVDFLLAAPALPAKPPGEAEVQAWLPALWQAHPACRVAERELFQAAMSVIDAKRERLPRLTGSIGLGDMRTWVGQNSLKATATAEVGVTLPLFDAGSISRGIEKAALHRDLAQRNVRNLTWSLVREVQNSLTALRTAQMEAEHRQTEGDEVRRLADGAKQAAALGQGDPLLPFTLRIYQVEAELGELEAKVKLAKAARDYQVALGEQPVPGLSQAILDGLVRDLGKK